MTSIGTYAFHKCTNLASIDIPENVTSIGDWAFYNCSSLASIILPESLTSIGNSAFRSNNSLVSISIPEGVTSTGEYTFANCYNLVSVALPESLTTIGNSAFFGCDSLSTLTIPDGVTSIGHSAFHGCSSLTSITIPEGVTDIGRIVFYGCIGKLIVNCNIPSVRYSDYSVFYDSKFTEVIIGEGVTSIGDYAFYGCSSITSFTIPKSVVSIGSQTFDGCSGLTSIAFPESISSIGKHAFYNCTGLTSITLPESIASIGDCAFLGCSSLISITIPKSVTYFGSSSFSGCTNLTSVIISEGVTSIGDGAFSNCRNLTSIILPKSLTSIGDNIFSYCASLTSITIPEGVTSVGKYAFQNCSALVSITIPKNVASIGKDAFYGCNKLNTVTNYSSLSMQKGSSNNGYVAYYAKKVLDGNNLVTIGDYQFYTSNGTHYLANYIGDDYSLVLPNNYNGENYNVADYAFYGYNDIRSLTIGSGVLAIGTSALSVAPEKTIWLTNTPPTGYANAKGSINYVANDQYYTLSNVKVYSYLSSIFEVDGVKYTPVSPSERTCHAIDCVYDSTAAIIQVGETAMFKGVAMKVTEVMPYTFYGNNYIKEVSIAHQGNIGTYAFGNCDGMQSIAVANQGYVNDYAFYDCDNVESVRISNQGDIGYQAFYECDSMVMADIRNRGGVGRQAFYGCSSLKMVTLGDEVSTLGDMAFCQCTSLQEIVIPDSVKSVGASCFSYCSSMKRAKIGDGVTSVREHAFSQCTSLEDVKVGNGVATINYGTFTNCSALTKVTFGSSVTTISNYAFEKCSSLPEITLPQTLTKVENYAFTGCTQLADVIIEDRTQALELGSNGTSALFSDCPLDSVYIGGKITYSTASNKGYSPFYRNSTLRTVVITDSEEQIYENEFYGCTNLKNVTIGNGVKSIGNYAFSGCSSLDGFSFGSGMETIGAEAFSDCINLTSITSHAIIPPVCGAQALDDIDKWNCVARVPQNYMEPYQDAEQWKEFFFIEDVVEVEKYMVTYMVDDKVWHTETFAHREGITHPDIPTKEGYTFGSWSGLPEVMPAEDIIVSATFSPNKYLVTFKADDKVVATDSIAYGTTITLPGAPFKEGYSFNGWSEVPEVMPAKDVTISGTFTINTYWVYYYAEGELVHSVEVVYGEPIPEYIYKPTKEGAVFKGWFGEIYDIMPAYDVRYKANITSNVLQLTNGSSENGQCTICDLQGRKLTNPENLKGGIYIVNGKKMLIK